MSVALIIDIHSFLDLKLNYSDLRNVLQQKFPWI